MISREAATHLCIAIQNAAYGEDVDGDCFLSVERRAMSDSEFKSFCRIALDSAHVSSIVAPANEGRFYVHFNMSMDRVSAARSVLSRAVLMAAEEPELQMAIRLTALANSADTRIKSVGNADGALFESTLDAVRQKMQHWPEALTKSFKTILASIKPQLGVGGLHDTQPRAFRPRI